MVFANQSDLRDFQLRFRDSWDLIVHVLKHRTKSSVLILVVQNKGFWSTQSACKYLWNLVFVHLWLILNSLTFQSCRFFASKFCKFYLSWDTWCSSFRDLNLGLRECPFSSPGPVVLSVFRYPTLVYCHMCRVDLCHMIPMSSDYQKFLWKLVWILYCGHIRRQYILRQITIVSDWKSKGIVKKSCDKSWMVFSSRAIDFGCREALDQVQKLTIDQTGRSSSLEGLQQPCECCVASSEWSYVVLDARRILEPCNSSTTIFATRYAIARLCMTNRAAIRQVMRTFMQVVWQTCS